MNYYIVFQLLAIVLKLAEVIHWSWWLVFIPTYVAFAVWVLLVAFTFWVIKNAGRFAIL